MKYYEVDLDKRKRLLKSYIKKNIKNANWFSRLCYILAGVLRILAIVLAIVNILYVAILSKDGLDLIFLIMTFGFPMLLSLLPSTVYIIDVGGDYILRRKETIAFTENAIIYSHKDDRSGLLDVVYSHKVNYSEIEDVIVDELSGLVEIHGNIIVETYENSELKETLNAKIFDFLNAYDEDVVEIIKKSIKHEAEWNGKCVGEGVRFD